MAGRIPKTFIDDLLARTDIVELIGGYVPLKKAGANYQALCPFHDEKTPSFTVSQSKQIYYCFGCNAGGSAVGFVMAREQIGFIEAIEVLAERVGLSVPREGGGAPPTHNNKPLYAVMEKVVKFYREQLHSHPGSKRVKKYISDRTLDADTVESFEVGYAPPGWENLLKLSNDAKWRERLLEAGLIKKNDRGDVYDTFRDRLMFPIRNQRGLAIGLGGRVLAAEQMPKYLNSPTSLIFAKGRELYGLYQAKKAQRRAERMYVTEGYMDVLALAQHGIRNAVATMGTAITHNQVEILFRNCATLVFCFDGDAAGRKAARRAMEQALPLLHEGRQVLFRFVPDDNDPDSYVRQHGAKSFLDEAQHTPLSEHLIACLLQGGTPRNMEQRGQLVHRALPHLRTMPESTLRQLLYEEIANLSGLTAADLQRRARGPRTTQTTAQLATATGPHKRTNPLGTAISVLLREPGLANHAEVNATLADIDVRGVGMLRELVEFIGQHSDCSLGQILEHWRDADYGERLRELVPMDSIYRDEFARLYQVDNLRETLLGALRLLRRQSDKRWLGELSGVKSMGELSEAQLARLRGLSTTPEHSDGGTD